MFSKPKKEVMIPQPDTSSSQKDNQGHQPLLSTGCSQQKLGPTEGANYELLTAAQSLALLSGLILSPPPPRRKVQQSCQPETRLESSDSDTWQIYQIWATQAGCTSWRSLIHATEQDMLID